MPLRPPGAAGRLGFTLIALIYGIPFIVTAQQQQPQPPPIQHAFRGSPREASFLDDSVTDVDANHRHHHPSEPTRKSGGDTSVIFTNERAIATLAPADHRPAVRAPPARPAASSAGLSTRHQARSLQDWEVADFVLLATVDGKIYARDRKTGEPRWALESDSPMVETVYHRTNQSTHKEELEEDDLLWLVEPSQDGNLYIYSSGPNSGIQKLGLTVKQLVEDLSPYAGEDPPVVYTGEKKNTLFTIDAATGRILKMFSSSGSTVIDEGSCRRLNGLEGLDEDECESVGTLTLGRTEYIVGIQNQATGDPLCTIRYFEWGPNNRDKDLQSQYVATMDNKYVYSKHDGSIVVLDHTDDPGQDLPERPVYRQKFSAPVVRVYDVARPFDADSRDPSLVILPQPIVPASSIYTNFDNVFVNCTSTGSWYAMSETTYPSVTDGASKASCYSHDWNMERFKWGPVNAPQHQHLVGVHPLAAHDRRQNIPTISGPEANNNVLDHGIPRANASVESFPVTIDSAPSFLAALLTQGTKVTIVLFVCSLAFINFFIRGPGLALRHSLEKVSFSHLYLSGLQSRGEDAQNAMSREQPYQNAPVVELDSAEAKPAVPSTEETLSGADDSDAGIQQSAASAEAQSPAITAEDVNSGVETAKPKKKAHRGQRGGRKRRKGQTQNNGSKEDDDAVTRIVEGVKQIGRVEAFQPDQVTADGSIITDVSGEIELNNLKINTDKILGAGSGGTFVFEGKFEGRLVAVKRMLPQYFELASQEVSLLQQSDDHPNVIRYFCQQRDQNFLYIAVELCQASLWDLYQGEEPLSDERSTLVNEINCDVPRALYQLAAGLNHLHNLRIIHRDIKPQNILIAYPKKNQASGPRFVISDFGLCKTLPDNASTLIGTTGNAGTVGWKAPELINTPANAELRGSSASHSPEQSSSSSDVGSGQGVKRAVDIFSLGCVFFYVLTGGGHPFDDAEGWVQLRELNVKKGRPNLSPLSRLGDDAEEPIHLLSRMLAHKPEARPSATQVLQHPFFWSVEKRLAFLCDVSDHWEREPRDPPSPALSALESFALEVTGPSANFLAQLDRKFVDALGRQRKYVGSRLLDLLRALRNKRNHYEDLPPDVQARVGPLPGGYLRYWTSRFPKLLMACYGAVEACQLQSEPRFRPYFESS